MVSFRATEDELYVLCLVCLCFHSYRASLLLFGEKENRLRVQFKPRYSIKYNRELACALCVTVPQCPRIITLVPSLLIVEVCMFTLENLSFDIKLRNRASLSSFVRRRNIKIIKNK